MGTTTTQPNIEELVSAFLQHKQLEKENKTDLEALKKEISQWADNNVDSFDKKGVLRLEAGIIKIGHNPPKAIYTATGRALTPKEREELLLSIPSDYTKASIDLSKASKEVTKDKHLKKILEAKGVDIVQDSRYDVKSN